MTPYWGIFDLWLWWYEFSKFQRIQDFCKHLFEQVDDPTGHFARLDLDFSELFDCRPKPVGPVNGSGIAERVCHRLRRLLTQPAEFVDASSLLDVEYTFGSQSWSSSRLVWEYLQVTTLHNTNTIRIALLLERDQRWKTSKLLPRLQLSTFLSMRLQSCLKQLLSWQQSQSVGYASGNGL